MKTTLQTFWNRIPEERRPLAVMLFATFPLAFILASQMPTDAEYAAERAARENQASRVTQETASQAAQQAASDALRQKTHLENSVKSQCWQFARRSVKNPGSLRGPESWINGELTSDFVVIQPITAENDFGARRSATAICSGSNGVIHSYKMDG